jgi:hypothetical protein
VGLAIIPSLHGTTLCLTPRSLRSRETPVHDRYCLPRYPSDCIAGAIGAWRGAIFELPRVVAARPLRGRCGRKVEARATLYAWASVILARAPTRAATGQGCGRRRAIMPLADGERHGVQSSRIAVFSTAARAQPIAETSPRLRIAFGRADNLDCFRQVRLGCRMLRTRQK